MHCRSLVVTPALSRKRSSLKQTTRSPERAERVNWNGPEPINARMLRAQQADRRVDLHREEARHDRLQSRGNSSPTPRRTSSATKADAVSKAERYDGSNVPRSNDRPNA